MTTTLEFRTIGEGQRFRLADVGSGPAVVLLHGFPDGPESWADTAEQLVAAGQRVIVPFLRGYHPDTVVPGRSYGAAELGADVIGLLDALGIERAIIVGHDWGASCVWNAVAQAPGRVDGLVSIAIPHPATIKPSLGLLWKGRHFARLKLPGASAWISRTKLAYIDRLYRRWAPDWSGPERDSTVARAHEILGDPATLAQSIEWYRDLELKPEGAARVQIACPGLLVAGEHDFGGDMTPYEKSLRFFDGDATSWVADGAGHWPHREQAGGFDAELLAFVERVRSQNR